MIKEQLEQFFYWINERHWMYISRFENEDPWPWTDDEVLLRFKFTNCFRELDRGTIWLKENWREPYADHPELFFNICLYRQFNWWPTAEALGFHEEWDPIKAEAKLRGIKAKKDRIYTNAHMLTGTLGGDKIEQTVWKVLTPLWDNIDEHEPQPGDTLEQAFKRLLSAPGFGPFLSYEVITDLRHTRYLNAASDIMTWANPGPGAMRGINRLYGDIASQPGGKTKFVVKIRGRNYVKEMRKLLALSPSYLEDHVPDLEMRDIEHSLCEFDKYMRAKLGQGRPRLNYTPPHLRS